MKVDVEPLGVPDALLIHHEVFGDDRGFFMEVFREDVFAAAGLPTRFVQLNHSRSAKNVVRGLHFQWEPPMGKLMRVTRGAAFLVGVDVRVGSPTLGQWVGVELSAETKQQMWAPAGFARGFCALTDDVEVQYACTGVYNAAGESGILWNDPVIGIEWPVKDPILSPRDVKAQTLAQWLAGPDARHLRYDSPDDNDQRGGRA
jgi:dTDP-4-dehydrorhamnose 3,5-epimerase